MGFFDFIGKAVGAVKNLIGPQSGIVSTLGSLAGMVAHAVPGIGPIVDVAVPALQAIFSDGSAPLSAPQDRLDQPSNIVNFERTDKMIGDVLTKCQSIQDTLSHKVEEIAQQIGKEVADVQRLIRHEKFKLLSVQVKSAVKFLDLKQDVLKNITASSGPSAFEQIFPTNSDPAFTQERLALSKTIDHIKGDLEDVFFVPSQDTVELYLFSVHWLMLYDKVRYTYLKQNVIICRGMQAKSLETWGQYTEYLNTLGRLKSDIYILQKDAKEARDTLLQLGTRLTEKREAAVSQISKTTGDGKKVTAILDSWQTLGIGWKTQDDVAKAVNVPSFDVIHAANATPESKTLEDTLASANFSLYRDVIAQTLQVYLQPCNAVIESLEDSIRNWKAHLPVSPIKLEDEKKHAIAERPVVDDNCQANAKSKFWDRKVAYAVTYVNQYGESPESEYCQKVEVPQQCTMVKIKFEKVQFEGDFTAGLKLIKTDNDEKVPRDRGIRRRVYVRYTDDNQKVVIERLGDVSEADMEFTHHVLDPKKSKDKVKIGK